LRVSVVVPALNEERFIARCLESIRRQGVPVEIVVVDNGSTDRTVEIARLYADKVLVLPSVKLGMLRQRGTEASTGDIIVSLDADCVIPEDYLDKLLRHFENPRVVAVGGDILPFNKAQKPYADFINSLKKAFAVFSGANTAFRRSAWEAIGGYRDLQRAEDWDLSQRLKRAGLVIYDPEVYVYTDIPIERPFEVISIGLASGLLGAGLPSKNLLATGLGAGFLTTEIVSVIVKEPSELHHSHLALGSLGLLALTRGSMRPSMTRLLSGFMSGIFWHHWVTEDVGKPHWGAINGAFLTGIVLFLSSL